MNSTPVDIIFDNAIDLDRGIFLDHILEGAVPRLSQWMTNMRTAQAKIIAIAKQNRSRHAEIHMQTEPINPSEYPVNSYVVVEHRHSSLRK
jgi:hypothetical protein